MDKVARIDSIASFFAVLWLMYVMNTVIAWFSFSTFLIIIATFGVILCTFALNNHERSRERGIILFLMISYCLWEIVNRGSLYTIFTLFYTFVPFMCLLFWPVDNINRTYILFRKIVLFFAVGSSVITVLSYVDLVSVIPHFEVPPHYSSFHENNNDVYNIYFIFPELVSTGSIFRRACGMSLEPGHFSIVLGFIYLIDRYLGKRINPVIIICAILAFSPAFFLVVLFVEFLNIRKYFKKFITFLSILTLAGFLIYNSLPNNMKEMVYYLAYERNVEKLIDAFSSSASLNDTLDERANSLGISVYKKMDFGELLVGGKGDSDIILSDYRGYIVAKGLISLMLIVLISLYSFSNASLCLKVSLFLTLLMIFLHRSWMFYEPFPFLMSFLASTLYRYEKSSLIRN